MIKNLRRALVAIIAVVAISTTASAQFSFGPRIGIAVNSLKFNEDILDGSNRTGFTGGVQAEFMIPALPLRPYPVPAWPLSCRSCLSPPYGKTSSHSRAGGCGLSE